MHVKPKLLRGKHIILHVKQIIQVKRFSLTLRFKAKPTEKRSNKFTINCSMSDHSPKAYQRLDEDT